MATEHAKSRPPSAAKRWLSCPVSAKIVPMYPNDETDASVKGDHWHEMMEDQITFGTLGRSADPDVYEAMGELYAYVVRRIGEMGGPGKVKVYVEQRLDIVETGEFGTVDILLVSEREIEVIDEKSGYVPVHVKMNAQLLIYLLGAIHAHGTRKKYRITIHQPNFDHIDGAIRSYDPTDEDIEWLRGEITYSLKYEDELKAGKHCKDTYCPHRGTCVAFHEYVGSELLKGWHTSEIKSVDDATLARALDAVDELSGWRNVLRAEGLKRIMNMNRQIDGYKVVRGRRNRTIIKPLELVNNVYKLMGAEWAIKLFPDLAPFLSALSFPLSKDDSALKFLGTPKHVEDVIKLYAREAELERGEWKKLYANVVGEYIRETAEGLTLERAIDGRPAHKRGSEFGALASTPAQAVTII